MLWPVLDPDWELLRFELGARVTLALLGWPARVELIEADGSLAPRPRSA